MQPGCIMWILPPFFSRLRRAFTSMILVIGFRFCNKAIVSWIWVNVFQRRACIMLTLAYFFVYGKPAKCWVYIYVFALVAGLSRSNFGSSFFMFWRHCTNLILTKFFSWLFLVFVIVILAFFFCTCCEPVP